MVRIGGLAAMAASCVAMGFCWASEAAAQSPESFYKGRQIRMVIPSGAGGGYDSYARMLSQHIRRHIPGNPNIVDQNMPGASGMLATSSRTIAPGSLRFISRAARVQMGIPMRQIAATIAASTRGAADVPAARRAAPAPVTSASGSPSSAPRGRTF